MISRTGKTPTAAKLERAEAFTLVELILVMALLVVVMSIAAPTLSRFFHGRALGYEAGRLLALTRYGQNEAVSTGVPMVLWLDGRRGTYGLRDETGYVPGGASRVSQRPRNQFSTDDPVQYTLNPEVHFQLLSNAGVSNGVAMIRFEPDGAISEESIPGVVLIDDDQKIIPIVQSSNRLNYEISDDINILRRRR